MTTVAEQYGNPPPKLFTGFKMEEECLNPTLAVGIEIEVEDVRHDHDDMAVWCKPWGIGIKGDGSLRVVNGRQPYEFITKPTATRHVLPILRDFFRKMEFGQHNFSDRTSIHVHADCSSLDWKVLANISLLYTVFEEILFEFVNRRPGSRDGYSRDTNLYCVPWNQCRDHYNVVQGFLQDPSSVLGRWQKYTALNLAPLLRQNTIEFRHMHGTADIEKLKTWLNIIGSIFLYASRRTHDEVVKEIMEMNTVSRYEEFFNEALGRQLPYNDLYRMKLEEGLIFAKYSMVTARAPKPKKAAAPEAPQAAPQAIPGGIWGNVDWAQAVPVAEAPVAGNADPMVAFLRAREEQREAARQAERGNPLFRHPPRAARRPAVAQNAQQMLDAQRADGAARARILLDDVERFDEEEGEF